MRLQTTFTALLSCALLGCAQPTLPTSLGEGGATSDPPAAAPQPPPVAEPTPPRGAAPGPEPPDLPKAAKATPPARSPDTPKPPDLSPWFEGTEAWKAFRAKRWEAAAAAFSAWLEANPTSPKRARAALLRFAAELWAGRPRAAAAGLDGLVGKVEGLDDFVRLLAAQAWLRQGMSGRALQRLDAIDKKSFSRRRQVSALRARALAKLERKGDAKKAYARHLKRWPASDGSLWMQSARAHLAAGDKRGGARALRNVIARAPHSGTAIKAERMLKELPRKLRVLTAGEQLLRLRRQYDQQRHSHAIKTGKALRKKAKPGAAAWCEAGYRMARAYEKWKKGRRAAPLYKGLVTHCPKWSGYTDILYYAAKRSMFGGAAGRALALFAKVRKLAPKHSYVDDTLIWAAGIHRDRGANRKADKLLQSALAAGGDMQEKAGWLLFWHHYEAGRLKRAEKVAKTASEKLTARALRSSRGRLVYWHARTLQRLRRKVPAAVVYARVIREYPLTWYSWLAATRLRKLDRKACDEAIAASRRVAKVAPILATASARLADPQVGRVVELMRLGLVAFARGELAHMKFGGADRPADDWLLAWLYTELGEHNRAYRIARWRRGEHVANFPTNGHEERWRLGHPRPDQWRKAVAAASRTHRISEALVWGVMRTESAFRPDVVSIANAVGLMQLIIPTARAMARQEGVSGRIDRSRLTNPELNISLGARYLGKLARRFYSHPALMAAGYNAGPGGPMKWLRARGHQELDQFVENIPYRETRKYVKSVATAYLRYRHLYEKVDAPVESTRITLRLGRGGAPGGPAVSGPNSRAE